MLIHKSRSEKWKQWQNGWMNIARAIRTRLTKSFIGCTDYPVFHYWHFGPFQCVIDRLRFSLYPGLLCTPRRSPCCRHGCPYCRDGMAHFYFTCRNRILYRAFCFGLDWTILWPQSWRKKAFLLQRPPIPPHWPGMVYECLSKQTTAKI